MTEEWELSLPDEAATRALGGALARACEPPCVIHLEGELGAGKTTLVRGLLRALGHEGRVKSPSYGLLESYEAGGRRVFHLDLYRLSDPAEAAWLGLEDLEVEPACVLVEWPEKGRDWLPAADLLVRLQHAGEARRVSIVASSESGRAGLSRLDPVGALSD